MITTTQLSGRTQRAKVASSRKTLLTTLVRHRRTKGSGKLFARLPPALREAHFDRRGRGQGVETTTCCVYGDGAMLVNALLAAGSFKRFAPKQPAVLFTSQPKRKRWLAKLDLEVRDADEPLRAAMIDPAAFTREHPGITGHYYRKVAMWLHALRDHGQHGGRWLTFIDADVLFVRPVHRLMRHVRGHRFAAMVEHWHPSVWWVLRNEPGASHREVNQLFHEAAPPARLRRTGYYNSGVMLARAGDEDVIAAMKDVLAASLLYPHLSRGLRLPEQTLLNVATTARKIAVRDIFGLCVPSYHGGSDWPTPVVRHYLGDPMGRQPAALLARYPKLVAQSLAAVGTSVDELRDKDLWNDEIEDCEPTLSGPGAMSSSASAEGLTAD